MILLKEILRKLILRESWDRFISLGDGIVISIFKNPEKYEIEEDIFKKYNVATARGIIDIKSENLYAWNGDADHEKIVKRMPDFFHKEIVPIYIFKEDGEWKITLSSWSVFNISTLSHKDVKKLCDEEILNKFNSVKKITNIPIKYYD